MQINTACGVKRFTTSAPKTKKTPKLIIRHAENSFRRTTQNKVRHNIEDDKPKLTEY